MHPSSRAHAHGPALIGLLARLRGAGAPAPTSSLSDRLGQWIDWRHAVALAAALEARSATASAEASSGDDGECARVRAMLVGAIEGDRAIAPVPETDAGVTDAAFFRQRCLAMQQKMEAEVGHLRGRLRGRLMRRGGELARLAAIDAVMERALGPRERALLAPIPELLEQHYRRLRTRSTEASVDTAAIPAATSATAWLDAFRSDMRHLLLAELDLRLQPAEGLLAALRSSDAESDAP